MLLTTLAPQLVIRRRRRRRKRNTSRPKSKKMSDKKNKNKNINSSNRKKEKKQKEEREMMTMLTVQEKQPSESSRSPRVNLQFQSLRSDIRAQAGGHFHVGLYRGAVEDRSHCWVLSFIASPKSAVSRHPSAQIGMHPSRPPTSPQIQIGGSVVARRKQAVERIEPYLFDSDRNSPRPMPATDKIHGALA